MPHKLATNEDQKLGAVVLAGGQGSRMNGLDKGMQLLQGQRLVTHALNRLQAQSLAVASIAINANRHLTEYTSWGLQEFFGQVQGEQGRVAGHGQQVGMRAMGHADQEACQRARKVCCCIGPHFQAP